MVAVTTPMPLVVQIVPTRDKGGITKTRGTTVTREVVTMATKEGVEVRKREDTTPMRTNTRVVDPVAGKTNITPHRETTLPPLPVQVRIKVRTFVLMTWLLCLTMIHLSFLLITST